MSIIYTPIISNIPSTKKNEVGYRTVTSSKNQNEQQEEHLNDILDLFNKANTIEKILTETKDIIDCESRYLNLKLVDMENTIKELQRQNDLLVDPSIARIVNIYPQDINLDLSTAVANIDLHYSDITLNSVSSVSKVNIYDDIMDVTFVPPSLKVEVSTPELLKIDEIAQGIIRTYTDNNIFNPFDGDSSSYWIRKVTTDKNAIGITCSMTITLPEDIITTRDINEIAIGTYPSNSVDITNIQYSSSNGSWVTIPSFESHSSYKNDCIANSSNVKFNFNEISGNQLKISLRQTKSILAEGPEDNYFCIGLKEVSILNNKYIREFNTFNFDVAFEIPDDKIIELQEIVPIYNNPTGLLTDTLQFEYYCYDSPTTTQKITETLPFKLAPLITTMLVKCKLRKDTICPNLSSLQVKYKLVDKPV